MNNNPPIEQSNTPADEGIVTVNQVEGSSVLVDPVCGLEIRLVDQALEKTEANGRTFWFCSLECRWIFESDPERYAV